MHLWCWRHCSSFTTRLFFLPLRLEWSQLGHLFSGLDVRQTCLSPIFSIHLLPLTGLYWWFSSHRPVNTQCRSPRHEVFSHSISSLLFKVFSFPHHVNLLTLETVALSCSPPLSPIPFTPCCPLRDASLSELCYQPLFYLQTPFLFHTSSSHLVLSLSCFSSFGPLALLGEHWKSRENRKTSLWQQYRWTRLRLTWNIPFSPSHISFLSPPSLFTSSQRFFFSHYPFSLNSPSPALSIFQFCVTSSKGAMSSFPARIGCWEGELGRVWLEGGWHVPAKFLQSDRWVWLTVNVLTAPLGFYAGRGQPGCMHMCGIISKSLTNVNFTETFVYLTLKFLIDKM